MIYVGAKTGRDGIHGASLLASAEFSEESQQKRPNVQVGDPFMEKLLLEACLEAMRTGAVVAIQDMGAAGLTSSSSEMASRGGVGIEIDLARVPQRETGMTPYEIMLSESQERMLLVAERGREREVFDVFHKWGLDAVEVGRVTERRQTARAASRPAWRPKFPRTRLPKKGRVTSGRSPRRRRTRARNRKGSWSNSLRPGEASDLTENFRRLLASPAIASKRLDHRAVRFDGADEYARRPRRGRRRRAAAEGNQARAGAFNGRQRPLGLSFAADRRDARGRRSGAQRGLHRRASVAATNCLNFGNPEKPEVMWQFSEAIDGIAEACRALEIPITGGNVSFYNETLGKPIYPTPILGVLGCSKTRIARSALAFDNEGDAIVLLDGGRRPSLTLG